MISKFDHKEKMLVRNVQRIDTFYEIKLVAIAFFILYAKDSKKTYMEVPSTMKKTLSLILALVMLLAVCPLAQAEEQVTIRFAWWGDAVRHEATLKAIELFEAKYPHINVEPEYGGWDGYNDKLQTQIAGGTAADVVQDAGACRQLAMLGAEYVDFNDYT